ncbi:MAG: phosphatidate cytidylyltransferase [Chloroflexi bacterium]|nr:phosphatidate cytidylyltransferase [Chloroflexota bacterium]
MRQRVLSALVLVPVVLVVIWVGEPVFSVVVAVAALLGLWEFFALIPLNKKRPLLVLGSLGVILFLLNAHSRDPRTTAPLVSSLLLLSLVWILLPGQRENAISRWAWSFAAIFYLGWTLSHLILLRNLPQGGEWVILSLFSTFASDTSAFYSGRALGKHLLAPAISPKKTWEGAFFGFAGSFLASPVLAWLLKLDISLTHALIIGALVGIFGQLGDLCESALKRSAGVKDASHLIPGHGGILDRLDSVVFTTVVLYYYLLWVIR